jgi:hypothetical protein
MISDIEKLHQVKPSKMAKIGQDRQFSGYLGYGNYFFHCFSFDYGRA